MDEKDQFHKLQEFFADGEQNYHVLEEQIPVETQMAYFKQSRVIKKSVDKDDSEKWIEKLSDTDSTMREKKDALMSLASFQEVEFYRVLEKYRENPDLELKNWAILALNESRMGLESLFSEEKQVFISTGLGGKGEELRYFLVVFPKGENPLSQFEIDVIKKEFAFTLKQHESEIENILEEKPEYVSMQVLIPLHVPIRDVLTQAFDDCNQFGDFLSERFIVTNVKIMPEKEIFDFINEEGGEEDSFEELDLT